MKFQLPSKLPKRLWIPADEDEEKLEKEKEKQPIASPIINGKKFIGSGEDACYDEET